MYLWLRVHQSGASCITFGEHHREPSLLGLSDLQDSLQVRRFTNLRAVPYGRSHGREGECTPPCISAASVGAKIRSQALRAQRDPQKDRLGYERAPQPQTSRKEGVAISPTMRVPLIGRPDLGSVFLHHNLPVQEINITTDTQPARQGEREREGERQRERVMQRCREAMLAEGILAPATFAEKPGRAAEEPCRSL